MSRIGRSPVKIPGGVTIVSDKQKIAVTGPKGALETPMLAGLTVAQAEQELTVSRVNDEAENRARHGLLRSLINNMVVGVTDGFSKQLELNGVGYRVSLGGNELKFALGFSHEVKYVLPTGINAAIEQNIITISGIDKQQVGQVAAEIRALKKPEPYKGKGIKYVGERIIRKSGKSGKEK